MDLILRINTAVIFSQGSGDNNNNDFFCVNILEDQPQWRDKTKGLSKPVIVKQCVSRHWMDEEARRPRRIGSIKEIGLYTSAE